MHSLAVTLLILLNEYYSLTLQLRYQHLAIQQVHKANLYMPKFLDAHPLKGLDEETLRNLQTAPVDEFGIKHDDDDA